MSFRSLSSSQTRFLTRASPILAEYSKRKLENTALGFTDFNSALAIEENVSATKHAVSDGKLLVEIAKASHHLRLFVSKTGSFLAE
jgi:hypothetical protein